MIRDISQTGPVDEIDPGNMLDKLQEIQNEIVMKEERLRLLKSLQGKGITTADIFSFNKKQADLRVVDKSLDKPTSRVTMSAKIRDAYKSLEMSWCIRQNIRKQCRSLLGGKGFNARNLNRKTRQKAKHNNNFREKSAKNIYKEKHLAKKQLAQLPERGKTCRKSFKPTVCPDRLIEFESLPIFRTPEEMPKPQQPVGPYICDPNLVLSANEILVLNKDPKYSLMEPCTMDTFLLEKEKSLAKYRFGRQERAKKSEGSNIVITHSSPKEGGDSDKDDRDKLWSLWAKEKHRHIYDPFENTINFEQRRPTDYKLNKRICLPRPLNEAEEFGCELKKREYVREFNQYLAENKKNNKHKDHRTKKIKTGPTFLNLNKKEKEGAESLKKRIRNGEIMVIPTDKSARFSVMTTNQYIQAGEVHTNKDERISWKTVKYLRNQVNSHMSWLGEIFKYSNGTNHERMASNLVVSDLDLPEMSLLTKDHKSWSVESGSPVPTRPIVSGNSTVNTHLSELLSELIEPVALEADGAEVQSSEEALSLIDTLNKLAMTGELDSSNALHRVMPTLYNSTAQPHPYDPAEANYYAHELLEQNKECVSDNKNLSGRVGEKLENDGGGLPRDDLTPQVLPQSTPPAHAISLMDQREQGQVDENTESSAYTTNESTENPAYTTIVNTENSAYITDENTENPAYTTSENTENPAYTTDGGWDIVNDVLQVLIEEGEATRSNVPGEQRKKINDYFQSSTLPGKEDHCPRTWVEAMEQSARDEYYSDKGTLTYRIEQGTKSGNWWADRNLKRNENEELKHKKSVIQDMNEPPVMVGSDVIGLYPNLYPVNVAKITGDTVGRSKIRFTGIDYSLLLIYLFLILGSTTMTRIGLGDSIPRKKSKSLENIKSLSSTLNKDKESWDLSGVNFDDEHKKTMLSTVVQIMVLLMTSTTCYRFGGKIYRQKGGLGIGLRGSAAVARIVMCRWDQTWARLMKECNINLLLFYRYVDDIRTMLRPILKGWYWKNNTWVFDQTIEDTRTPHERTIQEIGKSMNGVWDFLKLTTESEADFTDGFLPTLDFAMKVESNGYIKYTFYSKPMSSNILLTRGTALSHNCIFSSIRQDLVRRLTNVDYSMGKEKRVNIVENFIQLVVNSGHSFQYTKAVVLQALSKYVYMVGRDKLPIEDKHYLPLHRPRGYDRVRRNLSKYTQQATWYTGSDLKEKFNNGWKKWIVSKRDRRLRSALKNAAKNPLTKPNAFIKIKQGIAPSAKERKKHATVMFVPKTPGGELIDRLQLMEDNLHNKIGWSTKLVEKPGRPLHNLFRKSFPMEEGCERGKECGLCQNDGNGCTTKRAVYVATCDWCEEGSDKATYIGETSRQAGRRVREHIENVLKWKPESFILDHWVREHGLSTVPPPFSFKIVASHKDALSRQLHEAVLIGNRGTLNRKSEFASNRIIRLESKGSTWEEEKKQVEERRNQRLHEQTVQNFICVMKSVASNNKRKYENAISVQNVNLDLEPHLPTTFRSNSKRLRMETSTPKHYRDPKNITVGSSPLDHDQLSTWDSSIELSGVVSEGTMSLDGDCNKSNASSLCNKTNKLEMTPPAVETTPQEMASNSIAANEYFEASDMFRRRIRSMPGLGASQYKPVIAPAALNKSRSMGDVDLLRLNKRDMTFQASGKTFYIEDWVVKEGTYGFDVLFMDDNEAIELETEEIIRDRTKNKLFQIFIKACGNKIPKRRHAGKSVGVLATPGKRKFSFSLPEPSPSDEGTASTARKKQCQVRQVDNSELNADA